MESITTDELLLQLESIQNELILEPRKEVAKALGLDVEAVTINSILYCLDVTEKAGRIL